MFKKEVIAVDLDSTLAHYTEFTGETMIGPPVPRMVQRVKQWLLSGKEVVIFTARLSAPQDKDAVVRAIENWCILHIGAKLRITNKKEHTFKEMWDDRAVQVIPNTGERADGQA